MRVLRGRSVEPFHPDLRAAARVLPRGGLSARTLPPVRWATQRLPRAAEGVEVHEVGDIAIRLHRPPQTSTPGPALLWIHGGGFVIGSAIQDDPLCRAMAHTLGVMVAAVDYRLAPEHPFPVPLHDCHDALEWLAERDDVDAAQIVVGGASAGGGLAAGLALLARDRGVVSPKGQLLVYPMLDDRTAVDRSFDDMAVRVWDNPANRFGWSSYLGAEPGSPDVSPLAAPARHEDLAGLPPAWIGVGTCDLFHDEDLTYARRLEEAGVPCDLMVVERAFHAFDQIPRAAVARSFAAARDEALAALFAGSATER